MTIHHPVFLLFFLGISLHTIVGQFDVVNPYNFNNAIDSSQVQFQEDPGTIDVEADEMGDEDDVRTRLAQADSLEEFLSLMQINGRPVTSEDIYDDLVDEDGKTVISGGGRFAVPDNCSPRNTTVRITMEGTDSDVAFFPRCTKIERCGGCCSSPHLECRPWYTERVSLKVLKGRIPFPGAPHLVYTGFAPVIVDRHVTCRVACTLTAARCGPKKRFQRQQCACKCKTYTPCPPPTIWDPEECSCKCPNLINCCPNGDNCGMVFNPSSCDCELGNDGRMNIANEGPSRNRTGSDDAMADNIAADATTPAAPSTTTTTAETTTIDPCENQVCPPMFDKVPSGTGCSCRPPRMGGRGRGSRGRNRNRG